MRWLLLNHVHNAHQSLRANRSRSMLTMLGVTIGVASVTAILALSGGASTIIDRQIDTLDGNIAIIRPGVKKDLINNILQPQTSREYAASTLTEDDITKLTNIKHLRSVAPLMIINGTIKSKTETFSNSPIVATTPEFIEISGLRLREGQFLDNEIAQNAVVVGKQLSIDLFGTESSIGNTLSIRGQPFIVVGVMAAVKKPINYNLVDFDNAVLITLPAGKKLNNDVAQIQQIDIKADSPTNLDTVAKLVRKTIKTNHGGENDFSVLTGSDISQPTSQFFYTVASLTTAIATISLVVGGIGIMNIMLVTVAERTREIGIRKALGASNGDIAWQFLFESLTISVCGGIAGFIFGYVIAFTAGDYLTFTPAVNWQIAATALFISISMGTIFGLYPAIRAARKDPIESLNRHN